MPYPIAANQLVMGLYKVTETSQSNSNEMPLDTEAETRSALRRYSYQTSFSRHLFINLSCSGVRSPTCSFIHLRSPETMAAFASRESW